MKKLLVFSLLLLASSVFASTATAQRGGPPGGGPGGGRGFGGSGGGGPGGGGPGGGGGRMMAMMPVLKALDADGDGELSSSEIDNAVTALRSLDADKSGSLSSSEMMPDWGSMRGGRGGEGRRGGPGGGEGRRGGPGGEGRGGNRDGGSFADRMLENDADGDGKVSKAEAPERMQGFFDNLDGDGDGYVTKEEMEAMSKRWRGGGGDVKAPKRPGAAK